MAEGKNNSNKSHYFIFFHWVTKLLKNQSTVLLYQNSLSTQKIVMFFFKYIYKDSLT